MSWESKLRIAIGLAVSSYLKGDRTLNQFAVKWIEELVG
jgi:hypothetical protein